MTTTTHDQERQAILKEYPLTYFIAAAVLFIIIGIAIGALLFGQNSPLADADNSYFSNVYLTIISTAFTVIVIDRLNRRRDEQRDLRQLQEQLVRDVRSTSNEVAKNAVHQLQERGWLFGENGLLKGMSLIRTNLQVADLRWGNLQNTNLGLSNLQGVNLVHANLQDARLDGANLQDANLESASLQGVIGIGVNLKSANLGMATIQGATLVYAKLEHADLGWANLQGANLESAKLQDVNLDMANLQDVNLEHAKLNGANLEDSDLKNAKLNEFTVLPDGTNWTPDTDMSRFTDRKHPNFWRSDDEDSPAYYPTFDKSDTSPARRPAKSPLEP